MLHRFFTKNKTKGPIRFRRLFPSMGFEGLAPSPSLAPQRSLRGKAPYMYTNMLNLSLKNAIVRKFVSRPFSLVLVDTINSSSAESKTVKYIMAYHKMGARPAVPLLVECSYVRKCPNYISAYLSSHAPLTICDYTRQLHQILKHAPQENREKICVNIHIMVYDADVMANKYIIHSYSKIYDSLANTARNYDFPRIYVNFQARGL